MPVGERRHPAREMLGDGILVTRQQAQREAARVAQELVHGRLPAHAHADERGIEGEGDERADRQAETLTVRVDSEDGNPRGEAA
jgi:hypothetical protein